MRVLVDSKAEGGVALRLGLLLVVAASGSCMRPPAMTVERAGPLVFVSSSTPSGMAAAVWRRSGDGPLQIAAATWDDEEGLLTGFGLDASHEGPRAVPVTAPAFRGAMTPPLLVTVLLTALADGEPCSEDACLDALPEAPRFGREEAERSFAELGLDELPAVTRAVEGCAAFPGYAGDQRCTGWVQRIIGLGGGDLSSCCLEHDTCFFACPLGPGGACRGTPCISGCNQRFAACCAEQGGDPLQCGTYEIATELAGGGGRNGCGRAKAHTFCTMEDFASDCEGRRCICEECAALFPDDVPLSACAHCTCADECDPDLAASCGGHGGGPFVRRCASRTFSNDEHCFTWSDELCPPGQMCALDDEGEATCVDGSCPEPPLCPAPGVREHTCRVDDTGPYYRECAVDGSGCVSWRRRYCDNDTPACVVFEDGPVCR